MSAHSHEHGDGHAHSQGGHGHSHGLVDPSIKRSREGLRAVGLALLILGVTAAAQLVVYLATDSIALLADLIHNFGDAATAIPLGIAFALRSARAERWAGLAVVLAIFVSACVAGYEAVVRLLDPRDVEHLGALAAAGASGSRATGWRRSCASAPAGVWTVPRSSPTAPMRVPTRTSPWRSSPAPRSSRPGCRSPIPYRPGDHAGDPAHHLELVADGPRARPARARPGWLTGHWTRGLRPGARYAEHVSTGPPEPALEACAYVIGDDGLARWSDTHYEAWIGLLETHKRLTRALDAGSRPSTASA